MDVYQQDTSPLIDDYRDRGLLIGAAGDNVARMAPPLTITEADARTALEKLDEALKAASQSLKG